MIRIIKVTIAFVMLSIFVMSCAPPVYLVGQRFVGTHKTAKIMIQDSGVKSGDDQLYNNIIRVCDLCEDAQESNCKDTIVLTNVYPRSIVK